MQANPDCSPGWTWIPGLPPGWGLWHCPKILLLRILKMRSQQFPWVIPRLPSQSHPELHPVKKLSPTRLLPSWLVLSLGISWHSQQSGQSIPYLYKDDWVPVSDINDTSVYKYADLITWWEFVEIIWGWDIRIIEPKCSLGWLSVLRQSWRLIYPVCMKCSLSRSTLKLTLGWNLLWGNLKLLRELH